MENRRLFTFIVIIAAIFLVLPSYTSAQGTWFWLHDENAPGSSTALLMDSSNPASMVDAKQDLNVGPATWYTPPFQSDQKIYGDVSISLFIEAYFLRTDILPLQARIIRVFLLDVSPSGVEDEIASSPATPMFFISNDTIKPKTFVLGNVDYTIPSGHSLGLRVEKTVDLISHFPFSVLSPFFATNVVYDSTAHPSSVKVPFNLTQGGIELDCYPQQRSVKAGSEVTYEIAIWNQGGQDDTVTLSTGYSGSWDVEIDPATVKVEANYLNYSDVKITPPADAQPGSFLNITINAQGSGGTASIWLNTTVAEPVYGVKVIPPDNKEGKPGDTISYTFTVKNTGDLKDTYSLSLNSGWTASLDKQSLTLLSGESADVVASVEIPLDAENGSTDKLTLTAQSQNSSKSDSASVTTTALLHGGTSSGGGKDILTIVTFILFVLGVIALLIAAIFLTIYAKKYVILGCEERMKEIPPGYSADYTITIKNPLEKLKGGKNRLNYKLAVGGDIPDKWNAELDKDVVTLDGGESTDINLHVKAPEDAALDEWASVDVIAKPVGKRSKGEKINVATLIREPKVALELESVEHEPKTFKEGEKVISKIVVTNKGEAPATNAQVVLYVNDKEKNRVGGLVIPVDGHVEVDIPWVAEPGENRVTVKVMQEPAESKKEESKYGEGGGEGGERKE